MMVSKTNSPKMHTPRELFKVAQKLLAAEMRELTHRSATKNEKSSTTDLAKTLVAAILTGDKPSKTSSSGKSRAA